MKSKIARGLALVNTFVGLYFAYRLTRAKQGQDDELLAACKGSSIFDCTAVNDSAFAEVLGFPTAAFGLIFYIVIAAILAFEFMAFPEPLTRGVDFLGLQLAALGFAVSLTLGAISKFAIGAFCEYCFYTYIVNLVLLGLMIWLARLRGLGFADLTGYFRVKLKDSVNNVFRWGYLPAALAVAVLMAAWPQLRGATSKVGVGEMNKVQKQVDDLVELNMQEYKSSPTYNFDFDGTPSKGSNSPALVLVEFADFNCGHCSNMARVIKQVEGEFAAQLKVYFKHFPLDSACNPGMSHSNNGSSCFAAKGTVCAGKQNRFWDMHDNLFATQGQGGPHSLEKVLGLGGQMGLNPAQFKHCMDEDATHQKLLADVAEGDSAGVDATPAVFLNGRRLKNVSHPLLLAGVLRKVLALEAK